MDNIKMFQEMLDEDLLIIDKMENDYNKCHYNGMLQAAYVLGYNVIVNENKHTVVKKK